MSSIDDVYGSNELLSAADIPAGKHVPCVIDTAEQKTFDDNSKKVKLTFVNKKKALICNYVNAERIAEQLGTREYGRWIGGAILLMRDVTEYKGKSVPCIRVVPACLQVPTQVLPPVVEQVAPPTPPVPANAGTVDDIPF